MSEVIEKTKKPKRRRSGTAKWHMSREAVNLPLDDIYKMDDKASWEFFVETSPAETGGLLGEVNIE
jgi:hypothetical protein